MMFYSLTLTCVSLHFTFIYIHIHTQSRVLCAYIETQRCRDLGSGLNISKTFFIGHFSLPSSAVILYFQLATPKNIFNFSFSVALLKTICCFQSGSFDCCALGKKKSTKAQRIELKSKTVVSEQETRGFGPWMGLVWSPLPNLLDNLSH